MTIEKITHHEGLFFISRSTGDAEVRNFRHGTEEEEIYEYLHSDGKWRLSTKNEAGEKTGWFVTEEQALAALANQ